MLFRSCVFRSEACHFRRAQGSLFKLGVDVMQALHPISTAHRLSSLHFTRRSRTRGCGVAAALALAGISQLAMADVCNFSSGRSGSCSSEASAQMIVTDQRQAQSRPRASTQMFATDPQQAQSSRRASGQMFATDQQQAQSGRRPNAQMFATYPQQAQARRRASAQMFPTDQQQAGG